MRSSRTRRTYSSAAQSGDSGALALHCSAECTIVFASAHVRVPYRIASHRIAVLNATQMAAPAGGQSSRAASAVTERRRTLHASRCALPLALAMHSSTRSPIDRSARTTDKCSGGRSLFCTVVNFSLLYCIALYVAYERCRQYRQEVAALSDNSARIQHAVARLAVQPHRRPAAATASASAGGTVCPRAGLLAGPLHAAAVHYCTLLDYTTRRHQSNTFSSVSVHSLNSSDEMCRVLFE